MFLSCHSTKTFYTILFIFFALLFGFSSATAEDIPQNRLQVQSGFIDLSDWDFKEEGSLALNGKWEFYWKRFVSPETFRKGHELTPDYVKVPGVWNNSGTEESPRAQGYATYRIQIKVPGSHQYYALKFKSVSAAYKIWVNGKLAGKAGEIGTSKEEEVALYNPQNILVDSEGERFLEIVMHISNFRNPAGGIWMTPYFGTYQDLQEKRDKSITTAMFLSGALIIMAIYHFGLFYLRPDVRSSLYFALICILYTLNSFLSGETRVVIFENFGGYEGYYNLFYASLFFSVPLLGAFAHNLFPNEFNKRFLQALIAIFSVAVAGILTFDLIQYHFIIQPLYILILIFGVYLNYSLFLAYKRKKEGAGWLIIGILILLITVINDVLNSRYIIFTDYYRLYGVFFMVLSQAFVLALRFSGAFNMVEDLSNELKEKNRSLTQLDKLKDDFLSNTSHELRTPLNGIIGIADSLVAGTAGDLNSVVRYNLQMIVSSGHRLLLLINDILDFSKMKNHAVHLHTHSVHLKTIVDLVLKISSVLAQSKNIVLENQISEDFPNVHVDEDRLQQILFNLIGNAIKFTPSGKVTISSRMLNASMAEITVTDTGTGIEKENLERIFNYFEQGMDSLDRNVKGTGLGLSITKNLVELHGGTIQVDSIIDRGSSFSFTVPVSNEPVSMEQGKTISPILKDIDFSSEQAPSEQNSKPLSRQLSEMFLSMQDELIEVLVVDDEPVNLQVVSNILSMENVRVVTATNGVEAMKIINDDFKPYLILLDLMMPYMNGYDTCTKIREKYSASDVPVIIMTAKNHVSELVDGFHAGANDYLVKPFSREELLSRISIHLQLAKAHRLAEHYKRDLELTVKDRTIELDRALEKISVQNGERKELIHLLCHDLANPVGSALSVINVLGEEPKAFEELVEPMKMGLQSGMDIINSIRKLVALDEGRLNVPVELESFNELLDNSLLILNHRFEEKGIQCSLEVEENLVVKVDKVLFVNSVLNNILTNAIKFSPEDATINISAYKNNQQVIVTIKDQGIGIPPEIMSNLFRVDKMTTRKGTKGEKGTGFGMPLMKKFVEQFGGRVSIDSVVQSSANTEHGTTVTIYLQSGEV